MTSIGKIMKKITILLACSVLLLGLVVLKISLEQNTTYLDELQILLFRLVTINKYEEEANYARYILSGIIMNDVPPDNWGELTGERSQKFKNGLFYFFKVWFIESETTIQDIEKSYIIFAHKSENYVLFELRYGKSKPAIQFRVTKNNNNNFVADFTFPLNNCTFHPDYNRDNVFDSKDVALAKK